MFQRNLKHRRVLPIHGCHWFQIALLAPGRRRSRRVMPTLRNAAVSLVALGLVFTGLAHAESYRGTEGSITYAGSNEVTPLGGGFELSFSEYDSLVIGRSTLILDSFQFQAGDEILNAAPPYEYDGLEVFPLLFNLANQIHWIGDGELGFFNIDAGEEPEVADDGSLTFRRLTFSPFPFDIFRPSLPFRPEQITGTVSPGDPDGDVLPRWLAIEGILKESEQTFEIVDSPCSFLDGFPPPPTFRPSPYPQPPPGPGFTGGGIIRMVPEPLVRPEPSEAPLHEPLARLLDADLDDGLNEPLARVLDADLDGVPISGPCLHRISASLTGEIGQFSLTAVQVQTVEIDVKPRRRRNWINPMRNRQIPVAVLGSDSLDVRDIDQSSLRLGPAEAPVVSGRRWWRAWRRGWWWPRDVNRDGYRDRKFPFQASETGIAFGDDQVCLTGALRDGTPIQGCDDIRTPRP